MKDKFPLSAWALLGVVAAVALIFSLPRLLRWRGGTFSLPPLSSLPPVPTPAPAAVPASTPTPAPTLPERLGKAAALAPLRLRLEVAARAGDYQFWLSDLGRIVFDTPRSDIIPVLKSFLDDPDAFVRMRAAVQLGSIGDRSGDAALWQMALSPVPIPIQRKNPRNAETLHGDVRDDSIMRLAKDGVREAAPLCVRRFEETGDINFAVQAAKLGAREVIPALLADDARQRQENRLALGQIETFGRAKVQEARPIIEARFNELAPKSEVEGKTMAAWAMIQLGERGPYYDHLLQQAKLTVEMDVVPHSGLDAFYAREALKYLATVHTPEVQALLERALECPDYDVRNDAIANLCMGGWNPPSEAARQKLIFEFGRAVDTPFNWSLLLDLAAASPDPEVRAAASGGPQASPERRAHWRTASEDRVHWPGGYVYSTYMVR